MKKAPAVDPHDVEAFAAAVQPPCPLMGVDLGSKTIGLAVSDSGQSIASPLQTIRRTKFGRDAAALLALIEERRIGGLVFGYPLNMDGSKGPRVQATEAFVRNLRGLAPLPVLYWDERLSTVSAERSMLESDTSRAKRAANVDRVAASIILQAAMGRLSHIAAR